MNVIRNLDWFSIDGINFAGIGRGMLKCTNQLNYKTSPSRQSDGSMTNINQYDSFVVPQVEIGFKYITIDDFYKLRQILLAKRIFDVIYYDVDFNNFVAHEMYCHPDDLKDFLNRGEDVIGLQNFTITLVGTLNGKDKVFTNEYKSASGYNNMTEEQQRAAIKAYFTNTFKFSDIPSTYTVTGGGIVSQNVKWGRSVAITASTNSGYYKISGDTQNLKKFYKGDRINIFQNTTLTFQSYS